MNAWDWTILQLMTDSAILAESSDPWQEILDIVATKLCRD